MSAVIGWIIGILAVVVIGTIADLLLSETRIGKFVKSVFAAVTILVIILPIPSLFRNGCNFDSNFIIQDEVEIDQNFLDFVSRLRLNALARGVTSALANDGVTGASVEIEGRADNADIEIRFVRIDLTNAELSGGGGHSNIVERTITLAMQYLDIERGQVIISGG